MVSTHGGVAEWLDKVKTVKYHRDMTTRKEQILTLRLQGKTYNEICLALGVSKGTVSYYCGEGQVEKRQERQRRIRHTIKDYIYTVKQNSPCADCGENYPYWMMDFDHLQDKAFTVSDWRSHSASLERIKEEIAKCDIVCANCHRNRTHFRARSKEGSVYETGIDVSVFYEENNEDVAESG